jgi:hypothetical protein
MALAWWRDERDGMPRNVREVAVGMARAVQIKSDEVAVEMAGAVQIKSDGVEFFCLCGPAGRRPLRPALLYRNTWIHIENEYLHYPYPVPNPFSPLLGMYPKLDDR